MNHYNYKKRRLQLIKSMSKNSALIIPSWPKAIRSGDVQWPYRPSSDIIYLSGFEESDCCLIILSEEKYFLFVQAKDPKKEIWTGFIHGPEQVTDIYHMNSSYLSSEFTHIAPEIFKDITNLYYTFGINHHWDNQIKNLLYTLKNKNRVFVSLHDPICIMSPLRMKKDLEEINTIKKAVAISSQAHIEVMKHCQPGVNERELHGIFLSKTHKEGANHEAYPGIFASGKNACILHYTNNNRIAQNGELLLVDAGAEYNYYTSDITRTFPVNGKFSKTQKRLYSHLLKVQKQIIKMLKPNVFFNDIQETLIELMAILMREENILSNSVKEIIQKKLYIKYFPHSFGHLLGLDVHDITFSKTKNLQLKQNFVLTIEPGLYLPHEDCSLPPELRGLGFRIEDDILITASGSEVLSYLAPKEVEEIEATMNAKK